MVPIVPAVTKHSLARRIATLCLVLLVTATSTPVSAEPKVKDRGRLNNVWPRSVRQSPWKDPNEPRGAQDFKSERREIHIPEPMVFDLVRGLGAKQGEAEINVLAAFPVGRNDPRQIAWAPEIEAALFDGFALELELPFEDARLEAFKFAAQYTFGQVVERSRFIHGAQLIAESLRNEPITEGTFLYIPGFRANEVVSWIAMVGARFVAGPEVKNAVEAIVNFTVFADVARGATLGIELNYASGLEARSGTLLVVPQVHLELVEFFTVQLGGGAFITKDRVLGDVTTRFVVTF